MCHKSEIPRYIVRLPEGEREFDASEMLHLYRERKLNFSTMIRPVDGGEFR
ncbi:hypothetical protein KH017_16400 [bacterium]|nr:hypothetical protein [bacterium]